MYMYMADNPHTLALLFIMPLWGIHIYRESDEKGIDYWQLSWSELIKIISILGRSDLVQEDYQASVLEMQ